jgi:hypothetical protein
MTIQLTTKIEQTKEISVPVPSFYKEPTSYGPTYIAILDEQTIVKVYKGLHFSNVSNGTTESMKDDLANAVSNYLLCEEEEFINAFNDVVESMRLKPELV